MEREFFQRFDLAKAGFRTYIRLAVERFAANEQRWNRQKRGGGVEFAELDDESASSESPEDIFLQEWRRQLFVLAIEDLRTECGGGRRTEWDIFEAVRPGRRGPPYLRRTGAAARRRGTTR